MEKKVRFFQSVNFKIAVAFILILLISIEIIGAYFIRGLENSTIDSFYSSMDQRTTSMAATIRSELNDTKESADEVQQIVENNFTSDVLEIRVVDENNVILAAKDTRNSNLVGTKNDYSDLNAFTLKSEDAVDEEGKRVHITVRPIQDPSGDAVIGALYVRSNLERKYTEINRIAVIFFSASLIAALISVIITFLVSRSITQPIEEMRLLAVRIANGDYTGRAKIYGKDELSQLGESFNQLSERIEEAQDSMESERNRLDSVLTHMTDGVIATDRRGKVITINDMALSLLGVTSEETIGMSILTLLDIEKEYTFRRLLEETEDLILDRSNSHRESDQLIIKVNFSMLRRDSGFISGIVAVLHDVTEQERTEQERREFVSNVSHELRTPLTSMRSYIEALSEGAWQDEELAPNFLNVTLEETDRMIRMINDLLSLTKMDNGKTTVQKELVNFNEFVNFILDRFDMMVNNQEKKYVIRREFTQRDLWVEADPDKMTQVIDNIMNNAIKYSPDGGAITCRLIETHNNIIFSISDQGLGIPRKDLGRVFDRFYRVDKARARAQGGTGLGLAISKEVVKAHEGSIWAESQEGKGSTFYIALPYEPYEEDWWE
ncbi:two-component system sensor histidine kinase VicK [Enterococcus sp. PF1-24]|uniref:cell wall metabolism sensor histidine kinase WalK n=1 Tax=unclassified Enterococcus TaxID=2608891 RepID=UPI002475A930|nr:MULTISPECIES: cell wall metabolism sensor histidine kinase WalK [unclassified Enterococcus]MDH6363570.1 two-component system sensor histidine kinase VicK [Enterococcus sp. PFB1-1]MDH6400805.1 two-component system sensor histidine kinase VicK [Enterococcus sp. PF1-24]